MPSRRPSPPTERVVDVLDFLVGHPGERFGLSEIARTLGISKPTCLGIVNILSARGYLVRDPDDLTYGLGPALITAGRAAQDSYAVAYMAVPHLEALSQRYATTSTASALVGDQIMVLERSGRRRGTVRVGQPYPFAPPVGLMYALWDEGALTAWLSRRPTGPVHLDKPRLLRLVRECRQRGYLVESLRTAGLRLHSLIAGGPAAYDLPPRVQDLIGDMAPSLGERVYLDIDMAPRRRLPVSLIAAPTYDADGRRELVLTLYVGESVTGTEVARRAAALTAAAEAVTAQVSRPGA
jgi:DNA-binding IclR family transcriptional regulator